MKRAAAANRTRQAVAMTAISTHPNLHARIQASMATARTALPTPVIVREAGTR
jgi:hypothetical protein